MKDLNPARNRVLLRTCHRLDCRPPTTSLRALAKAKLALPSKLKRHQLPFPSQSQIWPRECSPGNLLRELLNPRGVGCLLVLRPSSSLIPGSTVVDAIEAVAGIGTGIDMIAVISGKNVGSVNPEVVVAIVDETIVGSIAMTEGEGINAQISDPVLGAVGHAPQSGNGTGNQNLSRSQNQNRSPGSQSRL